MENRKASRSKLVLPVKVLVGNDSEWAHTLDVSSSGARLGALRTKLRPGAIITLRRGPRQAKFRVQWVRQVAPTELQAGVEAVDRKDDFWGVNLADREQDAQKDMDAFLTLLSRSSKLPAARKK